MIYSKCKLFKIWRLDGMYTGLLLTLSLVPPTPEIPSELLKLSSQNHYHYGLKRTIKAIKEQQKTFRRQKDTPFSLRGIYHKILKPNWVCIQKLRNVSQI